MCKVKKVVALFPAKLIITNKEMEINNKFKIGDKVYYLHHDLVSGRYRIKSFSVSRINIFIANEESTKIYYSFAEGNMSVSENELFFSKEELIRSLIDED